MRDSDFRIKDMIQAIERIEKYSSKGQKIFHTDELVQTYIVHNLQILGEAASKLPEAYFQQHPEVPWRKIIGMRNILVHGYFEIDQEIVWLVVEKELPELKRKLSEIVEE